MGKKNKTRIMKKKKREEGDNRGEDIRKARRGVKKGDRVGMQKERKDLI